MPTHKDLFKKFNIAAKVTKPAPDHDEKPWLEDLVNSSLSASGRPAHLLLGESHVNGSFLETYMMLAENPGIFEAAAKNGVRHLVLEFPAQFQAQVDKYARHEINIDELGFYLFDSKTLHFVSPWVGDDAAIQFQAAFITVIDSALDAGLTVHFADVTASKFFSAMPPEIIAIEAQFTAQHNAEKSAQPLQQYLEEKARNLPLAEKQRLAACMVRHQQEVARKARLDDTEQFSYLRTRFPATEGIIGVLGFAHLDDSMNTGLGLNAQLESEGATVTTIELYNNRNTRDYMTASYKASGTVKGRLPDFTVILDDDAVLDKKLAVVDPASIPKTLPKPPFTSKPPAP